MTQLNDKVALVTGASSGLGAAVAQLFAERGATVFGIARNADRMAEVFADVPGGKYASVDISDPAACTQAVADCVAEFGRLDILANVAGFHRMRHTPTMTDEEWNKDLAVNLNGPFYLCRAALPHLLAAGGNIVNVASIAGVEGEVIGRVLRGQARADRADPRVGHRVHEGEAARQRGVPWRHADCTVD